MQLSIDFARRHQAAFSSVFWLDGRSEDQLKRSIAGCISKIPKDQVPETRRRWTDSRTHSQDELDDAVANVMKWLEQPDNCEWLLIFDNVDKDWIGQESGMGAYDPRRYLPGDHGSVLITTRLSRLAQLGESRKLGQVNTALSKAILERWFGGELGPDCANLLELLHGLPLALAQAGSYLREKNVHPTTYVGIYNEQWDELMGPHDASNRPLLDYNQGSVGTTWTISFKGIERQSPSAAKLLRLWSSLDNKQLWHGLLAVTANSRSSQDRWPQWLSEIGGNEVRFLDAVGLLLRYSMIEIEQGSKDGYSIHPIVHQWASYLDGQRQEDEWARLALAVVGRSVPARETREYWVLQRKLIPHAEMVRRWAQKAAGRWYIGDQLVIDSLNMLGSLYTDQGKLPEAEAMYKRALEGREKAHRRDHTSTLDTVNNLGHLYAGQGKLQEAKAMCKRALEGKEKVLGRDHISTLDAVNNLGNLYAGQGKLQKAETMYNRALEGKEKALGRDHISTLNTVNNLGVLYADQDKLQEAEVMYKRALEGLEKALGLTHPKTYTVTRNLQLLYSSRGTRSLNHDFVYKCLTTTVNAPNRPRKNGPVSRTEVPGRLSTKLRHIIPFRKRSPQ